MKKVVIWSWNLERREENFERMEKKVEFFRCRYRQTTQTRRSPYSDRGIKRRKGRNGVSRNTGLWRCDNDGEFTWCRCFMFPRNRGWGDDRRSERKNPRHDRAPISTCSCIRFFLSLSFSLEYDKARDSTTSRIPSRSVTWQFTAPA